MSYEQPRQKSEHFDDSEAWMELGGVVGESWILPELILGGFIADFFDNLNSNK